MNQEWLAERFEENRPHLRTVAYRMLGSTSEAEDAVQEAWLRLSRSDAGKVQNLGGWLTTVVGRVCLDMLRSRRSRREDTTDAHDIDSILGQNGNPEDAVLLADSVGLALLVVLDTLTPAERLALVLHDIFSVPYDEIAAILGRSPDAARQLASRARRRVQGVDTVPDADQMRQRKVVDAFFAATRGGDFDALVALLDPDVVVRADRSAVPAGARRESHGAHAVATQALTYARLAEFAVPAIVDGRVGAMVAPRMRPFSVMSFTIRDERIVAIDILADPDRLRQLEVAIVDAS